MVNFKVSKINSAGFPSVKIVKTLSIPEYAVDEIAGAFQKVTLDSGVKNLNSSLYVKDECETSDLNQVVETIYDKLVHTNLPCVSKVHVSYTNNPSDFVVSKHFN